MSGAEVNWYVDLEAVSNGRSKLEDYVAQPRRVPKQGQDLSLAPSEIRCNHRIEHEDASVVRCSRFTICLPTGERDDFCVSHSPSQYAALLRSKGSKAKKAAAVADAERRAEIAYELQPRKWRTPRDIQRSRFRLHRAVARGDVTIAQGKLLLAIIKDAGAHMRVPYREWMC